MNPQGFSSLEKDIKTEYPFVISMHMDYSGTPRNVRIHVYFSEEKTLDEIENIKEQIIRYFVSDDFYQAILSDKRFERFQINSRDEMGYFGYGIEMLATHNGGYYFSCESYTNEPVDVNDPSQWTVIVRDLAHRIGWPTAKPAD
jgi:hypothetical protein